MRIPVAAFLALVACGGAQPPAASEADTSSLEQSSGSSEAHASAPAAAATPAPVAAAPKAEAPPPSSPVHPVPGTTGSLDGKPFAPHLAQVAGPMQKDGRLPILIHEGSDCVAPADLKPGDGSITLLVPWKDGYKVDLASLRRAQKTSMGEAAFVRAAAGGKKTIVTTFKPTGLVTIVSAPSDKDALGKMKIDLQSGDYMLTGDLDVKVCVPVK